MRHLFKPVFVIPFIVAEINTFYYRAASGNAINPYIPFLCAVLSAQLVQNFGVRCGGGRHIFGRPATANECRGPYVHPSRHQFYPSFLAHQPMFIGIGFTPGPRVFINKINDKQLFSREGFIGQYIYQYSGSRRN